jgi:ArsR family metal-binding transcriptional regulator
VRELGLYAMDPNVGEILYMIAIDSQPDTMPSKNYSPPITISYTLNVIVTSEMSPNIIITPSGLVTVQMLNQAIQNHNIANDSHPNIRALINSSINNHNNNPNAHETEIAQKIQTHNTSTVSHLDIRDRLNEVSDSVQELWGEDLIEKKLNGDLTISNNATSRPVKLILIDNENITFGDEEFFTRHLEYNADGDITMKEE